MSRDVWGADWGKHYRGKVRARDFIKLRKMKIPAIYLMAEFTTEIQWFGRPGALVKIGKTSRNPYVRTGELKFKGFEIVKYWTVSDERIDNLERQCIKELIKHFCQPYRGKEYFAVTTIEDVLEILNPILDKTQNNSSSKLG